MDPNAALEEIRGIVRKGFSRMTLDDLVDLPALVSSLDEWISRGGFLPESWTAAKDVCAKPLRAIMEQTRADSGSDDPMEPFAYDARWEELAKTADAALAAVYPDLGGSDGPHQPHQAG